MSKTAKTFLLLLLSVASAIAISCGYLWLSRWPIRWFTAGSDYAALFVSIFAFVLIALKLPWQPTVKFTFIVVAVPVLGLGLFVFSLYFVGIMFGDFL